MNNTFNLNRFLMLFKKHTVEHGKNYLMSIAVLAGLFMFILGSISYTNNGYLDIHAQAWFFMWGLTAVGCIFTSLGFTALGDKKQAISLLTLPASHFEKYLVAWLYTFVIFQLVYVGSFYLVDTIVIACGKTPVNDSTKLINIFTYAKGTSEFFYPFIMYTLFHAIAFWGSVFFEKMHLIKTSFVFFIVLTAIIYINIQLLHLVINENVKNAPLPIRGVGYKEGDRMWFISAPHSIEIVGKVTMALFVAVLWGSTFFRLKEKGSLSYEF